MKGGLGEVFVFFQSAGQERLSASRVGIQRQGMANKDDGPGSVSQDGPAIGQVIARQGVVGQRAQGRFKLVLGRRDFALLEQNRPGVRLPWVVCKDVVIGAGDLLQGVALVKGDGRSQWRYGH